MALKFGMLGMFHSHADGLVKQVAAHGDEFRLLGAWEPDAALAAEKGAAWKKLLPELRVFSSAEELLAQPLDGVVAEGQVFQNLGYARRALEAGFPVMLEKPAGHNLAEHRQVIELARSKHLHVQMLYIFRYMAAVQEMFRRADAGDLGEVYLFRARLPKPAGTYERFIEELKHYRGGMFFEMAGHVIDMMVRLCGAPKQVKSILAHHHHAPPDNYIDNGVATFEMERAIGIIEVPAMEVVPDSRRVEVYGSGGALMIPHLGSGHLKNRPVQTVQFCAAGKQWETLHVDETQLHLADLREFAGIVLKDKPPQFSIEHDLIVQKALLDAAGMA